MPVELKEFKELEWGKDIRGIVSYSQYSMFMQCPWKWFLSYPAQKRKREPQIHFTFGTCVHEVVQEWLYKKREGKFYDPIFEFHEKFKKLFEKSVINTEDPYVNPQMYEEYYYDAKAIFDELETELFIQFPDLKYQYLGDEIPMQVQACESRPKIILQSYIDLVFYDKSNDRYIIVDIKTSTNGWGNYQMSDNLKIAQMAIYKHYFSQLQDVPFEKIQCMYYILKRKVNDKYAYMQKRTQEFIPRQDREFCEMIVNNFKKFVQYCFTPDGEYNLEANYPAIKGKNESNCKFCDFRDDHELCPVENRGES